MHENAWKCCKCTNVTGKTQKKCHLLLKCKGNVKEDRREWSGLSNDHKIANYRTMSCHSRYELEVLIGHCKKQVMAMCVCFANGAHGGDVGPTSGEFLLPVQFNGEFGDFIEILEGFE